VGVPNENPEEVAARQAEEIVSLRSENSDLKAKITTLEGRIAELEERLGRNPRNSSMPPSLEGLSKPPSANRAERRLKKRKPGKQPGSEGHHLAQVSDPDEVLVHRPETCGSCGETLQGAEVVSVDKRQVFEMPKVTAHVTEHQIQKVRCACGCETKAAAPKEATAPACYGPGIRALAVYLSVYQHVPYDRLAEIFSDLLQIPVSVGAVAQMVTEAGGGLGLFRQVVSDLLSNAPSVHFDETGARVEGSLHWVHVASNSLYTLLYCHEKRGRIALADFGVIANMKGVAIHDGFRSYGKFKDVVHALCNAHHLRELQAVIERFDQDWATDMIDLLLKVKKATQEAMAQGRDHLEEETLEEINKRYHELIEDGWDDNWSVVESAKGKWYEHTAVNLVNRLDIFRDDVLRFSRNFDVSFDNNQAERDIRMVKLQQKISGSWRTKAGADDFCAIRSYVSTMKKNGHDVLEGLRDLFEGRVWLPGGT
jgi:transposase